MRAETFRPPCLKKRATYGLLPWLIVAVTLLAAGVGFVVLRTIEARMVAAQGESLATLASAIAVELDEILFERYGDLSVASQVLAPTVADRAALTRSLARLHDASLFYRWLGVADATGRIVAATDQASLGTDQSGAAWFRQARDRRGVIALDDTPSVGSAPECCAVTFAAPLEGPRGEFAGVVAGQVRLDRLADAMASVIQTFRDQVGESRRVEWQVLNHKGALLVDSHLHEEGTATNLVQFQLPSALASAEGGPGWVEEEHLRRKLPVVTGYARTSGYGDFAGFGWLVLVRMDRADILEPIRRVVWTVGLAGGVLWLPMLGLLVWMTGRLREEWHLTGEQQADLQTILTSIGDAVIVTDTEGRVAFMNPVAEALTGWRLAQAVGQPLEAVFVIVNEATRQAVESPVAKVLREGVVVGLANHTVLLAKDGAEVPIDDSGAPIRDPDGRLIGVVLVFRDIRERKRAEAQFRALLEAAPDAMVVVDQEGRIVVVNAQTERLFGYRRAELIGHKVEMLLPVRFRERHASLRSEYAAAPTVRGVGGGRDLLGLRKDGSEVPVEIMLSPVRTEAGCWTVAACRDLTDRQRMVEALKDSELRFRTLIESASDAIVIADHDGFILSCNGAAQRMFGYGREELIGRPLTLLMPARYRDAHRRGLERARVAGESRTLLIEVHGLRKDGTEFPVECAIFRWTHGGATCYGGILRDISDRKRLERRLAAQYGVTRCLAEARTLVEAVPCLLQTIGEGLEWDMGAYWHVDRRAALLKCVGVWHAPSFAGDSFVQLTRSMTFLRGIGLPGRIWASGAPAWIADVWEDDNFPRRQAAREAGVRGAFGFPILVGREVVGVLEFFSRVVREPDQPVLDLAAEVGTKIGQFIEHKDLEEQFRQIQKMDSIGRLAGGVAHDFNNLLTVINGYSDMLRARVGSESPLARYVDEIRKAGERASALTNQLLAFSRRQVLEPQRLNLNDRLRAMESLLKRLIGEDIELVLVLAEDLGFILADPSHLDQVVMNLASNARDAMPSGGKLTIETANVVLDDEYTRRHALVRPGEYVMLSMTDTGCGMDAETQARIFEPFFTTKEHGKGTGLGLATVYGIVRQSGGTIWVYSEVNRGTTFKIYLPRVREEAGPAASSAAGAVGLGGTETVLLVEDEDGVRALAEETLTAAGYRVLSARHGPDALVRAHGHQGRIHLLLTDVVMPGMSGRELADRLLPVIPHLKVLYMSGYTDNAVVHQGVLDPGVAYLPKPFSPEGLLRKVRAVLDAR